MEPINKLIVHGLMKIDEKYLIIKRTPIKRGTPNSFPGYWDIPGGMVEPGELPKEALTREAKEEVNLDIRVINIIHEDSNLDFNKNIIFTRLVYICDVLNQKPSDIVLQLDEHNDYRLINNLEEMKGEKVVDYLIDIFDKRNYLTT